MRRATNEDGGPGILPPEIEQEKSQETETWVLHASPDWSRENLQLDPEPAAELLLDSFRAAVGGIGCAPDHLAAHRWRFALPLDPLADSCLFDAELMLAACGDWCAGPRVEGAFLSGCAAAERLLALDPGPQQPPLFDAD